MRAAGTARRRTGGEREAFLVTDYEGIWPIRPAYSLPVGGWANENPVWVLAFFIKWKTVKEKSVLKLQNKTAIPWKRITGGGYVFPWAGWKEVVRGNYAVNTACCKHRGSAPETMGRAVRESRVSQLQPCRMAE